MARIFVSYRRADTQALVGRICDRLKAYYGADAVFVDVDDIPYGTDFSEHIRKTLERTDVVLAVMGPAWEGAPQRRIDDSGDFVRIEVETALALRVPLIPVLADGATMPAVVDLPESIRGLGALNAAVVSSGRDFHTHLDRLIADIDALLGAKAPARAGAPPFGVAQFATPATLGIVAALALPFVLAATAASPPVPAAIAAVTVAVEIAAMYVAMTMLRLASRAAERAFWIVALCVALLSAGGYMIVETSFVYQAPATGERFVKGFVCTSDARVVYKDKCPWLGLDELRGAEYDAPRLWTTSSISIVTVAMDALWLIAFIAIAALTSAGVAFAVPKKRTR
jgi:hypothetical protein